MIHDQVLHTLPAVWDALLREEAPEDLVVIAVLARGGEQQAFSTSPRELQELALQRGAFLDHARIGQDQGSYRSGAVCFRIRGIVVIAAR